jgi:hypothetical protein
MLVRDTSFTYRPDANSSRAKTRDVRHDGFVLDNLTAIVKQLRQAIEIYNQDIEQLFTICRCLRRVIEEVKQRQKEMLLGE